MVGCIAFVDIGANTGVIGSRFNAILVVFAVFIGDDAVDITTVACWIGF